MADSVTGLPGRGQTLLSGAGRTLASSGQSDKLEGIVKEFNDRDSESTAAIKPLRSQRKVKMILVRNVSGITLTRGMICTWKAGKRNRQVDGYCRLDHVECAGVVDEMIGSGGVPNYDLFWLAVKGPHLILRAAEAADAQNLISEGDIMTAMTAAASTHSTTAGRAQPAIHSATTNVTNAVSIVLNQIGVALSAGTSANTGGSAVPYLYTDLDILKSA